MADLLNQLVQLLSRTQSSTNHSGGATTNTATASSVASLLSEQRAPLLLQVLAAERTAVVLQLGREQISLNLPASGNAQTASVQRGDWLLLQMPPNNSNVSAAGTKVSTLNWQQVTQLIQALARTMAIGGLHNTSAETPRLQNISVPVQVQLPTTNSPLQITYSPPSASAESRTQWPLALNAKQQSVLTQSLSSQSSHAYLQLRLDPATLTSPRPQVELQLSSSPQSNSPNQGQTQTARIALHQLPPPLVSQLLQQHRTQLNVPNSTPQPQLASLQTPQSSNNQVGAPQIPITQQLSSQAVAPLRAIAQHPAQMQQHVSELIQQLRTLTTPNTPPLINLLQSLQQQLPQGQQWTQAETLQHWVSQWFAARPASTPPAQSLQGIGQVLLILLGARLAATSPAAQPANSPTQQWLQQTIQWTQQQQTSAMTPQTAAPNTGNAATQLTALWQQQPALLQRTLQLLGGTMNSARLSQAQLADSVRTASMDYHTMLPLGTQPNWQNAELLVQKRKQKRRGDEAEQDIWLFKLRMELQRYGPVLVKGRYTETGTQIQFITENLGARVHIQEHLGQLQARLQDLNITQLELKAVHGKVPTELSTQGDNIIHIQV